jgi:hypothetical protein
MIITGKMYGNYMSLKKGAKDCTKANTQSLSQTCRFDCGDYEEYKLLGCDAT